MADISKITLPNGNSYDLKDARISGIYPVKGTQTSTTASWAGSIDLPALFDGLTIAYYLPRTSKASATLNLVLKDGTKTGAIHVYYTGSTRMGTQIGAGSTVILTYWSAGSISVNGTPTTDARWTRADYYVSNSDHYPTAWCNTAADAAAKAASCTNFVLKDPCYIPVLIVNANTAAGALTLNINSTEAMPININGEDSSASNYTLPAGMYFVQYSGGVYYFRTDDTLPVKAADTVALYKSHDSRPTNANVDLTSIPYISRLSMMIAGSQMTSGKPPEDANILTFGWDAGGYGAQLAIGHSQADGARLYTRRARTNSTWETDWAAVYDSKNPPTPSEVGASPASVRITSVSALKTLIDSMDTYETRFIMLYNTQQFTNSKLSSTTRGYICKTDANVSDIMGVNAVSGFVNIRVNNSDASFNAAYKATLSSV